MKTINYDELGLLELRSNLRMLKAIIKDTIPEDKYRQIPESEVLQLLAIMEKWRKRVSTELGKTILPKGEQK